MIEEDSVSPGTAGLRRKLLSLQTKLLGKEKTNERNHNIKILLLKHMEAQHCHRNDSFMDITSYLNTKIESAFLVHQ